MMTRNLLRKGLGILAVTTLFVGCTLAEPEEPTTAQKQAAVSVTKDALVTALLASEFSRLLSAPDFGGDPGERCPTVTLEPHRIILDFGTGCVPTSGLLPGEVSGSVVLEHDPQTHMLSATCHDLAYEGKSVDGRIQGTFSLPGNGGGLVIDEAADFTVDDNGKIVTWEQDLDINIRLAYITINGESTRTEPHDPPQTTPKKETDLQFNGVRFEYTNLQAECPLPNAGSLTLHFFEDKLIFDTDITAEVVFHHDSPQTGLVTLTIGAYSEELPICQVN